MPSMGELIVAVKKVYLQIYHPLVETVNLQTVIFFCGKAFDRKHFKMSKPIVRVE